MAPVNPPFEMLKPAQAQRAVLLQFALELFMINDDTISMLIVRSVGHIFKNLLGDSSVVEVYETQAGASEPRISVAFSGTLQGEFVINMPESTLRNIVRHIIPDSNPRSLKQHRVDVAGEIANLITATFANQLQFVHHRLRLSTPDFNEESSLMKALYNNINLSFSSNFGGFDIDFYFKEKR